MVILRTHVKYEEGSSGAVMVAEVMASKGHVQVVRFVEWIKAVGIVVIPGPRRALILIVT